MEVVVVGSCMTDLVSYAPRFPKAGETLFGHKFQIGFGGKGANQCVVAARLGASAAMVAKVGNDTFGDNHLDNFKKNNVDAAHVGQTSDASTGAASITVNDQGQNTIVVVCGANLLLSESDIARAEPVIQTAKVVVCQLETEPATTLAALRMARKHQVITVFNPAPGQKDLHPELYTNADYFCPNETEAELITGLPVSTVTEARLAAAELRKRGCGHVIITMGERGAVYASRETPQGGHVPAVKVTAVDSTGAGDAFVGALAYYLARSAEMPLEEKISRASRIATVSVQAEGTQTSFPRRKDLPQELFA